MQRDVFPKAGFRLFVVALTFSLWPGCRKAVDRTDGLISIAELNRFENLFDVSAGDSGYGVKLLADNADGTKGSAVYQTRSDTGDTAIELLDWRTTDAGTETQVQQLLAGGDAHVAIARHPDSGLRIVAARSLLNKDLHILSEADAGKWADEVVDSAGDVGLFVDLKVGADGVAHVAYIEGNDQDLRYLTWSDGVLLSGPTVVDTGFETGQITPGGGIGQKVSLALDSTGNPSISYYDETEAQLRVARFVPETAAWIIEVVGPRVLQETLALDENGTAGLVQRAVPRKSQTTVYRNQVPISPADYEFAAGGESIVIAAPEDGADYVVDYTAVYGNDYGSWSNSGVDSAGVYYLSFFDQRFGDLVLARNTSLGSSQAWLFEIVDSFGVVGNFNSLGLFPIVDAAGEPLGGRPVIAYLDQSNGDLRIAVERGKQWDIATLANRHLAGFHANLSITDDGWVLVAYQSLDIDTFASTLSILRVLPFGNP